MSAENKDSKSDLFEFLRKKCEAQIKADLTTGRTDEDLKPYSSKEIKKFINYWSYSIENAVKDMIKTYTEDGELELLLNPEDDLIREFLYKYVLYDD